MTDRIYISATSQHVGKTTCTLGIYAALRKKGYKVGYCKPIGQEFVDLGDLKVDKDALLFARMMNFELSAEKHSPVILGSGATTAYLDNPAGFHYRDQVLNASHILQNENEIVVYEGTGHPGVGSVVDLSNADVAKLLGARALMVAEGGIGSTIDDLNVKLALFREREVPIAGVILNKVLPDKMDKVRHYVGIKLKEMGIPLLGILPFDKNLTFPIMDTIRKAINGRTVFNEDHLDNWVENIVSGALAERGEIEDFNRLLLIVHNKRIDYAIEAVEAMVKQQQLKGSPLAGIIVNGEGNFLPEFLENFTRKDYIEQHHIPVVSTTLDTYGTALKISKIEVKIHLRTLWKAERAIQMIKDYVDLEKIL